MAEEKQTQLHSSKGHGDIGGRGTFFGFRRYLLLLAGGNDTIAFKARMRLFVQEGRFMRARWLTITALNHRVSELFTIVVI